MIDNPATHNIRKTCSCDVYPIEPHFYTEKLGFAHILHIFATKHRLWVLVEPPRRGGSNVYPQSMFRAKIRKISNFSSENNRFLA